MISDTFEAIRPKLVRFHNYDVCQEEIQKLEAQGISPAPLPPCPPAHPQLN